MRATRIIDQNYLPTLHEPIGKSRDRVGRGRKPVPMEIAPPREFSTSERGRMASQRPRQRYVGGGAQEGTVMRESTDRKT